MFKEAVYRDERGEIWGSDFEKEVEINWNGLEFDTVAEMVTAITHRYIHDFYLVSFCNSVDFATFEGPTNEELAADAVSLFALDTRTSHGWSHMQINEYAADDIAYEIGSMRDVAYEAYEAAQELQAA